MSQTPNCGHLRVYHSIGLHPHVEYQERTGPCLFCALERYGQHEDDCNLTIKMIDYELPHVGLVCNCGLSGALGGRAK